MSKRSPSSARAHAELPASSSNEWLKCPAWLRLNTKAGPGPQGLSHQNRGIAYHHMCEKGILGEAEPGEFEGTQLFNATVDALLVEMARQSIAEAKLIIESYGEGAEVVLEEKVFINDKIWGTPDIVIIPKDDSKPIGVVDFKSGRVIVDVVGNTQLSIYGLGARRQYRKDCGAVQLYIIQPPANQIMTTWLADENYLDSFLAQVEEAARNNELGYMDCVIGSHCRWCKAKAICPAQRNKAMEVIETDFTQTPKLPAPDALTEEQRGKILEWKDSITSWLAAVEDAAKDSILSGGQIDGWKLVRGQGRRGWRKDLTHEQKCEKLRELGVSSPTKEVLKGIGEIEKEVGSGAVSSLTTVGGGKPQLVRESTPGEPYITIEQEFGDISEGE